MKKSYRVIVGGAAVEVVRHEDGTFELPAALSRLEGTGTALKPAMEDWHLARAPLSEDTVAANLAAHGTGALHIDACRIAAAVGDLEGSAGYVRKGGPNVAMSGGNTVGRLPKPDPTGRWPAHLLLSHEDGCRALGTAKVKGANAPGRGSRGDGERAIGFGDGNGKATSMSFFTDPDDYGMEVVETWQCAAGCAVAMLDAQSGDRPGMSGGGEGARDASMFGVGGVTKPETVRGDSGGASRFFFCAKPSTAEREMGLDDFASATVDDGRAVTNDTAYQRGATKRRNVHPTVKSVALMRWLMRLITPPGGLVLDLFAGSGTTGIAAMCEGFRFVGVEAEAEFAAIARARVAFAAANPRAFDPETVKPAKPDARQVDLFGRTGT